MYTTRTYPEKGEPSFLLKIWSERYNIRSLVNKDVKSFNLQGTVDRRTVEKILEIHVVKVNI